MSARENALVALTAAVSAAVTAPVMRDAAWPERVGPAGLVIVRDGRIANATAMLSPLAYIHEHEAEIELIVPAGASDRAALDALAMAIGAAIAADRMLGGAVEFAEPGPLDLDAFDIGDSAAIRAARLPVTLTFTTAATPLA